MAPPFKKGTQKFPALHGRLMVDTINGRVRVRAWPRKRGPNLPEQVRINVERFTAAQRLSKEVKGVIFNRFIEATKGTGLYPRDLFTKMVLNPPIELIMLDGRVIRTRRPQVENVVFQGFILHRTSSLSLGANVNVQIPWQDPVIDTAAFWDVSDPDVITIPEGVAVMSFAAGLRDDGVFQSDWGLYLRRMTPTEETVCLQFPRGVQGVNFATGPMVVSPGEKYAAWTITNPGRSCPATACFFSGQILAASV